MPTVPFLGSYGDISGSGLMFRNKLINGGFDIWQRGTSQGTSSTGFGADDRWNNGQNGSTKTASRQTFTLGQTDVPGNPKYWARTVVTSSAGASNYVYKAQPIESVLTLAGQTATLSFWAKADASKNIAVEFIQNFGTGGSPSSAVLGIGVTTFALTSSWKYFTATISIPSISGKVLGSNNDDSLNLQFWFDAGSTFNARTNSLGQQSGTFDIANVQLEAGPQATPFEQRPISIEMPLCMRYYQLSPIGWPLTVNSNNSYFFLSGSFPVVMRGTPNVAQTTTAISGKPVGPNTASDWTGTTTNATGAVASTTGLASLQFSGLSATPPANAYYALNTAGKLSFDAEL